MQENTNGGKIFVDLPPLQCPRNALDGIFLSADAARQLSLYPFTLGALESRGSHHDTPEKRIR